MPKHSEIERKKRAGVLVKTLLKNKGKMAAAARELGITRQAVREQVQKNPFVRSGLERYVSELERIGANDRKSAIVILDGMNAETYTLVKDGRKQVSVAVPDHPTRLKANEQYLKLKRLIGDKDEVKSDQHLHLHLGDKKTEEILTEIKNQLDFFKANQGDTNIPAAPK